MKKTSSSRPQGTPGKLGILVRSLVSPDIDYEEDILDWHRERFFLITALLGSIIGAFVVFFIVTDPVKSLPLPMLVIHALAWSMIMGAYVLRRFLKHKTRYLHYHMLVFACFMLGSSIVLNSWSDSPGIVWLIVVPVLASALFGMRGGLAWSIANVMVFFIAVFVLHDSAKPWSVGDFHQALIMGVTCLLTAVGSMGIGSIASSLRTSLDQSKALESNLNEREHELMEALGRAERESSTRRDAENSLRNSESKYRSIIEHSSDAIFIIDKEGMIEFAGSSVQRVFQIDPETLLHTSFYQLVAVDEREAQKTTVAISTASSGGFFTINLHALRRDGTSFPAEASFSNLLDDKNVKGIIITVHDLSRLSEAEARASQYEFFDKVTELPNRDKFDIMLEQAIAIAKNRDRVLAVMVIGMDRFKNINDIYGAHIGDFILKTVGERLRSAFRVDDIISRFHGDQFLVLLPEIKSIEFVKEIIRKAKDAFLEPFGVPGGELDLTMSVGVAIHPQDGVSPGDLVKNAETAMFTAKGSGRDGFNLFDSRLNSKVIERARIENEIMDGVRRDEFFPYFQSKVDKYGQLVGAEALIRWRTPEGTIIQPAYFIDVAERSGSISHLGRVMIRKTCVAAALWIRAGLNVPCISVNLSPYQFGSQDLVQTVEETLNETGLPAHALELEITESGIMENEREGIQKLCRLHDMGVRLSIDDFGTGYSSFAKLKDFPVDSVKIDKSFIDPVPTDRRVSAITRGIIDLAHTLDYQVVAEGVETRSQFDFLELSSCDHYQGFLFSRPIPASEFERILVRQHLAMTD